MTLFKTKKEMVKLKYMKKAGMFIAGVLMVSAAIFGGSRRVQAADDKPFVALGADLTSDQRAKVLELLGVSEEDLSSDQVITVTNADEHDYLDTYLSPSVIGTKALSSVAVWEKEDGYGVQVTTHNISYCTTGMYQNALVTAGLENAKVVVAGPFELSGTAALVGAIKAYSEMSGDVIKAEAIEAATEELVVTGEVSENLGTDEAEQLIGVVKDVIAAEDIKDEEDIKTIIKEKADELGISLSDSDLQKIIELMKKISKLDLDPEQLQSQAKNLYEKLTENGIDIGISEEEAVGFFTKIFNFFKSLLESIFG